MTDNLTDAPLPKNGLLISIVFFSGSGHTTEMAHAVAKGVAADDKISVVEHQITDTDFNGGRWQNDEVLEQLDASDAIIFGSPTYMGSVSAQLKALMDATSPRYLERKWVDKIGAAFTVSGSPSGDKLNMLMTCATFAMQHGMVWVGVEESPVTGSGHNRLATFFGAAGEALMEPPSEKPSTEDKRTGEMLGRRVARLAYRLHASHSSTNLRD